MSVSNISARLQDIPGSPGRRSILSCWIWIPIISIFVTGCANINAPTIVTRASVKDNTISNAEAVHRVNSIIAFKCRAFSQTGLISYSADERGYAYECERAVTDSYSAIPFGLHTTEITILYHFDYDHRFAKRIAFSDVTRIEVIGSGNINLWGNNASFDIMDEDPVRHLVLLDTIEVNPLTMPNEDLDDVLSALLHLCQNVK